MKEKRVLYGCLVLLSFIAMMLSASAASNCNISNMQFKLRDPNGGESGWNNMQFDSKSGSCPPSVTEIWKWTSQNPYFFCPVEGQYQIKARVYEADRDGGGNGAWRETSWTNAYTVDYCSVEEWCECSGHTWATAGGTGICDWIGECYAGPGRPSVTANPVGGDAPLSTDLTAAKSAQGDLSIEEWEFRIDGAIETHDCGGADCPQKTVNKQFAAQGDYVVEVRAIDELGNESDWSNPITISVAPGNNPPTACIDANPTETYRNSSVDFDGSCSSDSDGSIVSYEWDFGDGGSDSGQIVQHSYSALGLKTATLTVTDDDSATGSTTAQINIVNKSPVADFSYSPANPVKGEFVSFDASASSDDDGTIVSYTWDFDDGTGGGVSPTHKYNADGDYDVELTVEDNDGGTHSITKTVTVEDNPPFKPTITANLTSGTKPLTVKFDASTSDPEGDAIRKWEWDFGDGTPIEEQSCADCPNTSITHIFNDGGSFSVKAKAYDDPTGAGSEWSDTLTITVSDATVLQSVSAKNITLKQDPAQNKTEITLTCSAPGAPVKVTIEKGDGTVIYSTDLDGGDKSCGTTFTPSYKFTEEGAYPVRAHITNPSQCVGDGCSADGVLKVFASAPQIESPELHPLLVLGVLAAALFVMRGRKKQTI